MFISDASQFSFSIADRLVSLHNGVDSSLAFGMKSRDMLPCRIDFFTEGISFPLAFRMLRRGTFPFTRQAFCLHTKTLECAFQLPHNFAQPFGDGGVLEQVCPGIFDFGFRVRGCGKFLSIRLFCCS
jgi:hypothetical protein